MLRLTARGSGYYTVHVDDVEYSRHTAEREAIESASEALENNPGASVRIEHDYVVDVEMTSPPAPPAGPPPTEPPPVEPPPSTALYPVLESLGLPVVFEEKFADTGWQAGGGMPGWDDGRSDPRYDSIVPSPYPELATMLLGRQPPHTGGTGTYHFDKGLGGAKLSEFFIGWHMAFEQGFDHNNTSEKIIHLNFGTSSYALFQYHWGLDGVIDGIEPDPADQYIGPGEKSLPPNLTTRHSNGRSWISPYPADEVLCRYELYMNVATGVVRWWVNGEQRAEHVGRSFAPLENIATSDTWGGGGDKQGGEGRLIGHIVVAGR